MRQSVETTRSELREILRSSVTPMTTKEVAVAYGRRSQSVVLRHLDAMASESLVIKVKQGRSTLWEYDDKDRREYRSKRDAAKAKANMKRELGVTTYELLMRAAATVKTPGLLAEIEEVKRRVENCSAQKSFPIQ